MKSYEEIAAEVKKLIASELHFPTPDIDDSHPIADLAHDSIQLFELLIAFEQHYQLEVVYDEIARLHTVGDTVRYIASKKYGLPSH